MRILIVHDRVEDQARPDEVDVLDQVVWIGNALDRLGHSWTACGATLDLSGLTTLLEGDPRPDLVFNLVESLERRGCLIHLVPALLDARSVAYTGCSADAVYLTSNKLLAKRLMQAGGLRTPAWWPLEQLAVSAAVPRGRYLFKSVWEHASVGLDEDSVVEAGEPEELLAQLRGRLPQLGGQGFVEAYVDGREFNISLLDRGDGQVEVLPHAEIVFEGYEHDRPRVVGYQAKWDTESFAYNHTARRFDFPASDQVLLDRLSRQCVSCWKLFGLRGYARVDFRVDEHGTPWILEVNSNPCLAPDAGFMAALERAGIDWAEAVARILASATGGRGMRPSPRLAETQPSVSGVLEGSSSPRDTRPGDLCFRREARPSDVEEVRGLVQSTGFFNDDEVKIAVELVEERLAKGPQSGYEFVFLEQGRELLGYTCFGHVDGSESSFDLYWIAVGPAHQGRGLGRHLLRETERLVIAAGGRRLYADTSSRPLYVPTRRFYLQNGFVEEARLAAFYAPDDSKVIYVRVVA